MGALGVLLLGAVAAGRRRRSAGINASSRLAGYVYAEERALEVVQVWGDEVDGCEESFFLSSSSLAPSLLAWTSAELLSMLAN